MSQLDEVLGPEYAGDLRPRSLDDIRRMRAECQEVETGLSYLRRLVQGRLDIVGVEMERRRDGGAPGDLSSIIEQLPEILSDRTRAPGVGRLPQHMAPGEIDASLAGELDAILAGQDVDALAGLADDELAALRDRLSDFERRVSSLRRDLFERIDAFQAELTRRYRTGEASVESLLQ
jgi:hypothetical protein